MLKYKNYMAQTYAQGHDKGGTSERKPVLGIAILYTIGHFLLLLNRGFYWDGLYMYRMIQENRFDVIWANLAPSRSYALLYLLKWLTFFSNPIFLVKFIVFSSWFVAGVSLYFILRRRLAFAQDSSFFITSSFLLVPAFLSRVELSVLNYSLTNMLFFLAVLVYFSAEMNRSSFTRKLGFVGAWILFFFSFFTHSLLVFYGAFLLFLFVDAYNKRDVSIPFFSWGFHWLRSNFIFVALPLLFWAFKLSLGAPYGPALYYNENNFIFQHPGFLSNFADGLWRSVTFGFWAVINPVSILDRRIFAVIFVCSAVAIFLIGKKFLTGGEEKGSADSGGRSIVEPSPRWFFISGSILFFLAVLAYILVGKSPHVWGVLFATRHALLLPLPLSFILLGAIRALVRTQWQFSVQVVFLGLFITFNIYNYWGFDMDWYRSRALTESLRNTKNQTVLGASTLIFHDRMGSLRYMGRNMSADNYRTYVYEAFPEHFKFATLGGDVSTSSLKEDIRAQYEVFKSWNILPFPEKFDPAAKPVHVVVVSKSLLKEMMTVGEWLRLKRYELFADEPAFLRVLSDDLRIEVVPIENPELLFE